MRRFFSRLYLFIDHVACRTSHVHVVRGAQTKIRVPFFPLRVSHFFLFPLNFMKRKKEEKIVYSIILFNTFFGSRLKRWMKIKTAAVPDEQQQRMQKIKIRWKQFFIFSRCLVSCWNLSKMVELWKCFCNNYGRKISSEHVESKRGRILLFVNKSTTIIIKWNDVNNDINEIN